MSRCSSYGETVEAEAGVPLVLAWTVSCRQCGSRRAVGSEASKERLFRCMVMGVDVEAGSE
jgi:hypothetical protein